LTTRDGIRLSANLCDAGPTPEVRTWCSLPAHPRDDPVRQRTNGAEMRISRGTYLARAVRLCRVDVRAPDRRRSRPRRDTERPSDPRDGDDARRWLAAQPWSSERSATVGDQLRRFTPRSRWPKLASTDLRAIVTIQATDDRLHDGRPLKSAGCVKASELSQYAHKSGGDERDDHRPARSSAGTAGP